MAPSQLTQSNLHSFNGSLNNSNFVTSSSSNAMPTSSLSMPSLQISATTTSTPPAQVKMDTTTTTTIKIPTLTAAPTLSGNGVIYPAAALANLPQV